MKSVPTFLFVFFAALLMVSCYDSKPAPKYPVNGAVDLKQPAPATGGVNTAVKHYICSNNCAGSGGDAAGNCPTCGNAYVHNDAYHNNGGAQPVTQPAAQPAGTVTESSTSTINFSDPNSTEPAQNAAGVWHYTCGAGCEGGAGSAGNCSKCGGALAHNAAYHN
jgi:hypothetical protein